MNSQDHRTVAEKHLPAGLLFIDGTHVHARSGIEVAHINPATGEAQKTFQLAGIEDIDSAVQTAHEAFPRWKNLGSAARRNILLRIADLLEQDREGLGLLGAVENGTPVLFGEAISSDAPAEWFRYYAGWSDKFEGSVPPPLQPGSFDFTSREPYGVVAGIVAYNAPMAFMGLKVAAALAAGNTLVLKPSDLAPWSVLRFGEICREAGVPNGVVNITPGNAEAGNKLVTHPLVNKVSFTGGDVTARAIMASAAENLTPVAFELGGKSASIIFEDANLELAIQTALQVGVITQSGQACIAGSRLLVHESLYDTVVQAVVDALPTIKVGDPLDKSTFMGPIVSEHHCNRILSVIEKSKNDGDGELVAGGKRLNGELSAGYFIEPTVFAGVGADSSLAQNEVFGPVLAIIRFKTDEEAIQIANNSRYGLSSYVFTETMSRALKVADSLHTGNVCINSHHKFPSNLPFGGMKMSGFGREGGYDGIYDMTHSKSVQIGLPTDI